MKNKIHKPFISLPDFTLLVLVIAVIAVISLVSVMKQNHKSYPDNQVIAPTVLQQAE